MAAGFGSDCDLQRPGGAGENTGGALDRVGVPVGELGEAEGVPRPEVSPAAGWGQRDVLLLKLRVHVASVQLVSQLGEE